MASQLGKSQSANKVKKFDLTEFLSQNEQFQPLKEVFDYILSEIELNRENILQTTTKLFQKFMLIDKLNNGCEKNERELDELKTITTALEQRTYESDQSVSKLETQLDSWKVNIALCLKHMKTLPKKVDTIEKENASKNDKIQDLEAKLALLILNSSHKIDNISSDGSESSVNINSMFAHLIHKTDFKEVTDQVSLTQQKNEKAQDMISKIAEKCKRQKYHIISLENDIKDLKSQIQGNLSLAQFKDIQLTQNASISDLPNETQQVSSSIPQQVDISIEQNHEQSSPIKLQQVKLQQQPEGSSVKPPPMMKVNIVKKPSVMYEELQQVKDQIQALQQAQSVKPDTEQVDNVKGWQSKFDEMLKSQQGNQLQFTKISKRFERIELMMAQNSKRLEEDNIHRQDGSNSKDDLNSLSDGLHNEVELIKQQMGQICDILHMKADRKDLEMLRIVQSDTTLISNESPNNTNSQQRINQHRKLTQSQTKWQNIHNLALQRKLNIRLQKEQSEEEIIAIRDPNSFDQDSNQHPSIQRVGSLSVEKKDEDFLPWNRFPARDPNERIARVGQGFHNKLPQVVANKPAVSRNLGMKQRIQRGYTNNLTYQQEEKFEKTLDRYDMSQSIDAIRDLSNNSATPGGLGFQSQDMINELRQAKTIKTNKALVQRKANHA